MVPHIGDDTIRATSASSASVEALPVITRSLTEASHVGRTPFASTVPTVSTLELRTGGLHDGKASDGPCVRLEDVHWL